MKKTTLLLMASLLLALPLLASTAEGGEGGHGFNWQAFLGRILNFSILFGGLFVLLRKPVAAYFARRGQEIRSDIETRQGDIRGAENRLREINERLGRMEAELAEMRRSADESGRAEMARLDEAGRREAERILQLADTQMQQRLESAVRELKRRIADLAIERFQADLKEKLDERAQQRIIDRNIQQSGDLHE
jgi:F-type H+-transporting ATPase subunit b